MHVLSSDTVDALKRARNGTLVYTAESLGFEASFAGTISAILNEKHGQVSLATENKLRLALGLDVLHSIVEVESCEDCGSVHHARCHGHDGPVVVLAENEKITRVKKKKPPSPYALRRKALRAACKEHGVTVEDAAEMWLASTSANN